MSKRTFIKGAFILTAAGVVTRILGFFFRIYLSRLIGAEQLGLYQLVMPVMGVCAALCISGFEIVVTKYSARYHAVNQSIRAKSVWMLCTVLSCLLCAVCTILLVSFADPVAAGYFHHEECAALIRVLALSLPFSALHNLCYHYYIGKDKTVIPAVSMLFEQLIRIVSVLLIARIYRSNGKECGAMLGICGALIGEITSCIFCLTVLTVHKTKISLLLRHCHPVRKTLKDILTIAAPVSVNRLSLQVLQSFEATLIPMMLQVYGYSAAEALSVYGIITGMAFPVIMFPSTLTNSIAQMLMSYTAKAADSKSNVIKKGKQAFLFSVMFGFVCIVFFLFIGAPLGSYIFQEASLLTYIKILGFICPFSYLATNYKSMLNALGLTRQVLLITLSSEAVNLIGIVVFIPLFGIHALLYGMLCSLIVNASLSILTFYKNCNKPETGSVM